MSVSSAEGEINNNTESLQHSSTAPTDDASYTKQIESEPESELKLDPGSFSQNLAASVQQQTINLSSATSSRNPSRAFERFSPAEDDIITSRAKGKQREPSGGARSPPLLIENDSESEQEEFETRETAIDVSELPDDHDTSDSSLSQAHEVPPAFNSSHLDVTNNGMSTHLNVTEQTSKLSLSDDMFSTGNSNNRPKTLFTSYSEHATKSTDIRQRQLPPIPRRDSEHLPYICNSTNGEHERDLNGHEEISAFDILAEGPRRRPSHSHAGSSRERPIDLTSVRDTQEDLVGSRPPFEYPMSWQTTQTPSQRMDNDTIQANHHKPDEPRPSRHYPPRHKSNDTQGGSPPPRSRQFSDGTLPVWQSDAEVNNCPICSTAFTFFNRRHHCRKCGRVVCAPCSPHRIVIPNSFVVYPPLLGEFNISPDHRNRTRPEFTNNRYSSYQGDVGVEVRICEECLAGETESSRRRRRRAAEGFVGSSGSTSQGPTPHRDPGSETQSTVILSPSAPLGADSISRRRSRSNVQIASGRLPTHSIASFPNHGHSHSLGRTPAHALPPHYLFPNDPSSHIPSAGNLSNPRINNGHYRAVSFDPNTTSHLSHSLAPSTPSRTAQHHNRHSSNLHPTVRLKETDYCPICYLPLPPVSLETGERDREEHVAACIRRAESYSSPRNTARSMAVSATPSPPSVVPHQSTPSDHGATSTHGSAHDSADEHMRSQGIGRGGGRMVVYRATEKDTIDFTSGAAEGQKAECVICFEEVEVGDVIARLECLCRYHKKCIREWFDRKGNGECPIHAMND